MEKQKQTLLTCSFFYFACAALDVIQLIVALVSGKFNFSASVEGLSQAQASTAITAILIVLLVIGSLGTIIKLYLAFKGLNQANGKTTGYANITWAKIVAVLLIIGIVGTIAGAVKGTEQWYTLISPVVSLVVSFFYIKSATALKE